MSGISEAGGRDGGERAVSQDGAAELRARQTTPSEARGRDGGERAVSQDGAAELRARQTTPSVGYEDELREIAARYPQARSGLLPMLHLVQAHEGMVTAAGIEACAKILDLSAAEVSGVATFYTMYKRRPAGDYHVGVCTNTLCAVMGGDKIFSCLKEHLDVGNDETAPRREGDAATVSLEHIECNAGCDYAPVVMVNWEFMDNQTPESALQLVDDLRAGKQVHSTRGPRIVTWRESERVLAGYPDGLADEGPGAGPSSLAGLRIARERGWAAPLPAESGSTGTTEDKVEAVEQADTSRAESETKTEEA